MTIKTTFDFIRISAVSLSTKLNIKQVSIAGFFSFSCQQSLLQIHKKTYFHKFLHNICRYRQWYVPSNTTTMMLSKIVIRVNVYLNIIVVIVGLSGCRLHSFNSVIAFIMTRNIPNTQGACFHCCLNTENAPKHEVKKRKSKLVFQFFHYLSRIAS